MEYKIYKSYTGQWAVDRSGGYDCRLFRTEELAREYFRKVTA